MTAKEIVKRNLELTFDFVRHLINNQEDIKSLPDKCEIDFIEKNFSSISEKDLKSKKLIKVDRTFDIVNTKKSA